MRCHEMWPVTWIDSDRGCHETSWINWQWVPCQKDEEPEVLKHGYTFVTILQTLLSLLNPFWIDIGFIFPAWSWKAKNNLLVMVSQRLNIGDPQRPAIDPHSIPIKLHILEGRLYWCTHFQTYPCIFLSCPFRSVKIEVSYPQTSNNSNIKSGMTPKWKTESDLV